MKANPANPRRLLLVEDDDFLREITNDLLTYDGWEVQTARDGREGLDLFRSQPGQFSAVITDYQLPEMNGDALINHLKDLDENLPIVLYSGGIPTSALLSIVRHHRTVAVAKSSAAAKLLAAVEHVLQPPLNPGPFRRRAAFRVKTMTAAQVADQANVSNALIRDISTFGALIEFRDAVTQTESLAKPPTLLKLGFFGNSGHLLNLNARIVWSELVNAPGDSIQWIRAGVQFEGIMAETFQALQAWVEAEFDRTKAGWY